MESGVIEASSREAALDVLRRYGLYPTSLKVVRKPLWMQKIPLVSEVSQKDVILFTRQLAILSQSNIPVVESLETIARQTENEAFRETILKMSESVEGGGSISEAMKEFGNLFSPFYVGMVRAGEKSGEVPASLDYLAGYLEKQRKLKNQLMGAMAYPAFVMVVFFILMLVMSIFVVPNFESVFTDMDVEMPKITRIVISASQVFKKWWWALIVFVAGAAGGLSILVQQKHIKEGLDRLFLEIPVIGNLLKKIYLSRIALNISTLISGGVSISEALDITSEVVGNAVYKRIVLKAKDEVRAGKSIGSTLSSYPERFTPLFIQMTVAGEKTGSLDTSLEGIVSFYEEEVDRTLSSLLRFIEPALIMVLGVLVVILGVSLFLPLFQGGALSI